MLGGWGGGNRFFLSQQLHLTRHRWNSNDTCTVRSLWTEADLLLTMSLILHSHLPSESKIHPFFQKHFRSVPGITAGTEDMEMLKSRFSFSGG